MKYLLKKENDRAQEKDKNQKRESSFQVLRCEHNFSILLAIETIFNVNYHIVAIAMCFHFFIEVKIVML